MKILRILLIELIGYHLIQSQVEDPCDYHTTHEELITNQLDDCFEKNVKDSRIRMAIGYELCFGFNYEMLNKTVAEPLLKYQAKLKDELVSLKSQSCKIEEEY